MTGASGLVGRALCQALAKEAVPFCVLSRDPRRALRLVPSARSYHLWQPLERAGAWAALARGARAIVHLASPLLASGRWDDARRQALYDACVIGTRGVISAVAQASERPDVLICASTVAFYAYDARGIVVSTEEDGAGGDFLSRLAADWEAEAMRAEQFGVRTVLLRTALVLGAGGALPRLRQAARLGLGAGPAPGTQRQPWIHVDDEVGLLLHALADDGLRGPVNAVAPDAVTSAEFMGTLSGLLGTPPGLRSPRWLLRSRFGAGAVMVTHGRGAAPARALELGYEFRQPALEAALRRALAA
ncbi:MAG TPA: TIGR01777 family oxidoreductase [Candidatus Dormibacteraeota bacterium]|nr:TIGR01777 family oxidoreductase [Candidatus Dormibacteraeota bacterium]